MRIQLGFDATPRLSNIVYAPATSIGVASAAPKAIAGVAPTFMLNPDRFAKSSTLLKPTISASFTVGIFKDFAIAWRTVTAP
jgi:hypothetical protein